MRILVTGGTTFVSKYVAEYFASRNNDVFVINRGTKEQTKNVTLIKCDRHSIGDKLKCYHFDVIIDVTAYTRNDISSLLRSAVNFEQYIFISSSAVYPETNCQPFTEEQSCGKNSVWGDYGLNKLQAEEYLKENFPDAYILRPPYFYGVYENLYRELFVFDCALDDRKFYLPQNGDMRLQFFNVFDLCKFIEIILREKPENKIYNVGNKDIVTIKDWVTLCYKAAGKTPEFVNVDKSVFQRDYFCFYDCEYTLDVSKQSQLMPQTKSLEQGLKEEFEWYINNRSGVAKKPYMEFIDKNLS